MTATAGKRPECNYYSQIFNNVDATSELRSGVIPPFIKSLTAWQDNILNGTSKSERLDRLDCLTRYATFNRDASDVLLIASGDALDPNISLNNTNNSLLVFGYQSNQWGLRPGWSYWECGASNNFSCGHTKTWMGKPEIVENWNVLGYKIDHCLAKSLSLEDKCSLRLDMKVMLGKQTPRNL